MNHSEQIDKIAPAWIAALHEVNNVTVDGDGNWGKYATIGACLAVVKPVLARHGLAVQQYSRPGDGRVLITTRIWHDSGQWIEDEGLAMPAPNDPQKVGGSVTYGRRYALTTFFAIATADDDGQSAADTMRAEASKAHELHERSRDAFNELKRLSTPEKEAIKHWADGRSLTQSAMAADEQWLGHVESYLDELKASTS